MSKKNVQYIHYWPYWLYSVAAHAVLFSLLYFTNLPHQATRKIEQYKEEYITVKFVHEPIAFNKKATLSKDKTTSINPAKPVMHQYNSKTKQESASSTVQETIKEVTTQTERIDNINKDLQKTTKSLEELTKELSKDVNDFTETIKKQTKKLEELHMMLKFFDGEGNLHDIFTHTYNSGERNEISYSDFFQLYADAYLLKKDRFGDILPILTDNKKIEDIMSIEVTFEEDGKFDFSKYDMNPEFKDNKDNVLNHYKAIFDKMPKKFISPLECGLTVPYKTERRLINPGRLYNEEGKPLSLEELTK